VHKVQATAIPTVCTETTSVPNNSVCFW